MTTAMKYVLIKQDPKPRMLHRTDCFHPLATAQYRAATADELRTLPKCRDCARKEGK